MPSATVFLVQSWKTKPELRLNQVCNVQLIKFLLTHQLGLLLYIKFSTKDIPFQSHTQICRNKKTFSNRKGSTFTK